MMLMRRLALMPLLWMLAMAPGWSDTAPPSAPKPDGASRSDELSVATMEVPPFAMKDQDGRWIGITIELWEAIAAELGLRYRYEEYDLETALKAIASGDVDVGAAAFSVTADRAKRMNFTHTYFGSDLGIATSLHKPDPLVVLAKLLFSWRVAKALFWLFLVLLAAGTLLWLFERKRNASHFGGSPAKGLGAAFWWSAVTMTTVGYGDKTPITLPGRLVALVWMLASLVIISLVTGVFATAMTVHQLAPRVSGPQDLSRVAVGTLADSVADDFLRARGITPRYFETVDHGLDAVQRDQVDAFVLDHAVLSYAAARDFPGEIDVLDNRFEPSFLGLAMPFQQPYRRAIDLLLLDYIQKPAWDAVIKKYRAAH